MTNFSFEQKMDLIEKIPGSEDRGKRAVELLENKYGKQFGFTESRAVDLNDDFYKVIAYPADRPEMLFETRVMLDNETMQDEYAVKDACNDYCGKMLGRISSVNGNFYLRMSSLIRGFEFEDTKTSIDRLQEYNSRNYYYWGMYYTENDSKPDDLYEMINGMIPKEDELDGIVTLYVLPDSVRENVQMYLESHDKTYMDFNEIVKGYEPVSIEIEKGNIVISKEEFEERTGR